MWLGAGKPDASGLDIALAAEFYWRGAKKKSASSCVSALTLNAVSLADGNRPTANQDVAELPPPDNFGSMHRHPPGQPNLCPAILDGDDGRRDLTDGAASLMLMVPRP